MTDYVFETITAAQALAYNRATDSLTFSTPSAIGAFIGLNFTPATAVSLGTLSLRSPASNQTVVFGVGLAGELITMPDGSFYAIGLPGAGSFTGGAKGDGFAGSGGADTLDGQGGDDVLAGGDGPDILIGGDGADLFVAVFDDSPAVPGQMDVVMDWTAQDGLSFAGPAGSAANYMEAAANSFSAALAFANASIGPGGVDYVAMQVGGDVIVFADSMANDTQADAAVILRGRTLDTISAANIYPVTPPPSAFAPVTPTSPGPGVHANIQGNLDLLHIGHLIGAEIDVATSTSLVLSGYPAYGRLTGAGLTYDFNEQLTGGTVTQLELHDSPIGTAGVHGLITGMSLSAAPLGSWVNVDATQAALQAILQGHDTMQGTPGVDLLRGYDGNDLLEGEGGHDTIWGGNGDDTISATLGPVSPDTGQGQTYLRGEAGNDFIIGGSGFDDAHGNTGDDTVRGGGFDDWVVGGQGNDMLFGDDGGDLCYGQLGSDTVFGGAGSDAVVGGQANDLLFGEDGDDFITGDRGDDIATGGAGADTFHTNNVNGLDTVRDFNPAEGDRVLIDPGNAYTLSQVGLDTVIDMGGGNRMILQNVILAALPAGWILGG